MWPCGSNEAPMAATTGPRHPSAIPARRNPRSTLPASCCTGSAIHYDDVRSGTRHVVELDELSGSAGPDRPLRLEARGRLEPRLAYSLAIEGGPLRLLQGDAGTWPFTLDLTTSGARLHAQGALDARQRATHFQVNAEAEDLAPIERLVGSTLPRFGNAAVVGVVSIAGDAVRVSGLRGRLGESEFSGQLALDFGAARPRLSGSLSAATLDLRPLLTAQPQAQGQASDVGARARQPLPLRDLAAFDAEVDLKVERWLGPSIDIRDTRFAWRADARGLHVPLSATIAAVPVAGGLELDTSTPTPTLAFRLGATNVVLADADAVVTPPGHRALRAASKVRSGASTCAWMAAAKRWNRWRATSTFR